MNDRQPLTARSLDMGIRHLGWLVTLEHDATCAVCSDVIRAGAKAIQTPSGAVACRACGELHKPGGA